MIIKFKNGYTVKVDDAAGEKPSEILHAAKLAVRKISDATLSRTYNPNVSFSITALKNAIKRDDAAAIDTEKGFLNRDLQADSSDLHKNYVKMFSKELLEKIVAKYEDAVVTLAKAGKDVAEENAMLNKVKENWGFTASSVTEPAIDVEYLLIDDATGEVVTTTQDKSKLALAAKKHMAEYYKWRETHEDDSFQPELIVDVIDRSGKVIKRTPFELATATTIKPPANHDTVTYEIDGDSKRIITDDLYGLTHTAYGKEQGAARKYPSLEQLRSTFRWLFNPEEVNPKNWLDRLTRARDYMRNAQKDLTDDEYTEGIRQFNYFLRLGRKKVAGDLIKTAINGLHKGTNWPEIREEKSFAKRKDLVKEYLDLLFPAYVEDDTLKKMVDTELDDPIQRQVTSQFVPDLTDAKRARKIRDIPYFDPTEYPTIEGSKTSIERLKKEAAHPERGNRLLSDYYTILEEIHEFIEKGPDALVEAGWTKMDARHAIQNRYYALLNDLKETPLDKSYIEGLQRAISTLERVWDLKR